MPHRDSLIPKVRDVHNCDLLPNVHPENVREKDKDNGTPGDLFFPTVPLRIIKHSDGLWYLVVQEEFVIEIEYCPFCGCDLAAESETVIKPPSPVELGEEGGESSFDELELDGGDDSD